MSQIVKLVGAGIGLASEAYKANKTSKNGGSSTSSRSQSIPNDQPPQYAEVTEAQAGELIARDQAVPIDPREAERVKHDNRLPLEEDDEEIWALDDAASPGPENESSDPPKESKDVADVFLRAHPPPARQISWGQLPCPVILPQRRPKDKKRGFVKAYAPVLANCDIDQNTFLEFLKSFQQSGKADPWLNTINVAAMIAGLVPSITAMAVSAAVKIAVGAAMEVQRRTRSNTFLDRMNTDFFKPRGLFCLIMTYKPDSEETWGPVNMLSSIIPSGQSTGWTKKLRTSSGTTHGELELPEAAPLIFPALDDVAFDDSTEGAKKQSKMKNSGRFVADYFDRRAQAQYAADNPGSSLVQTHPKFNSRYADPNHPANSGDLVSLVTGGALRGGGGLGGVLGARGGKAGLMDKLGKGRGGGLQSLLGDKLGRRTGGGGLLGNRLAEGTGNGGRVKGSLVKKVLQKDVLYMMIANLPTEEEMEAGIQAVANQAIR